MSENFRSWLRRLEELFHPPTEDLQLFEEAATIDGPVQIVADSGCDLPPDTVEQYGISLVPLIVRFGEKTFLETDISREDFWQHTKGPFPPQTSQPSVGAFEEAFSPLIKNGAAVLCITITSRHSGTYNAAWAAAQRFPGRVLVWDSRSLSVGLGLQVLEAASSAGKGWTLWEVVRQVDGIRRNSQLTILLDTLEYIRRGGRLGRMITALEHLVRVLNIRPLLRLIDGELRILGAARSYRQGLARLRAEALVRQPISCLGVAHARRSEVASRLADEIAQQADPTPAVILTAEIGAALASHAGPGAVGVVTAGQSTAER